jgi:hypothetical protein
MFTTVSRATQTKIFKIQNLKFKTSYYFRFYVRFKTSIAGHVSAYLAIIRCIKISEGFTAILHTVVIRVDAFS